MSATRSILVTSVSDSLKRALWLRIQFRAAADGEPERPVASQPPYLMSDAGVPKRVHVACALRALTADFCAEVGVTTPLRKSLSFKPNEPAFAATAWDGAARTSSSSTWTATSVRVRPAGRVAARIACISLSAAGTASDDTTTRGVYARSIMQGESSA